jgi:hypothetical protein
MSFTRIAFFPGSAWAVGPAECMRENDMTVMTSWDLFDDMRTAQDELLRMNRAYGQRLTPVGQFVQQSDTGSGAQAWAPPVDISERKDAYLVAVELPGVAIEDLEITFQDGLLTIQGERHPAYDSAAEKGLPGRGPLRRVPPVDHPAQPRDGRRDRSHSPRRRSADPGTQGNRSARQAHPGPRRRGQGRRNRQGRHSRQGGEERPMSPRG